MKIVLIANFVNFPWESGNCRFIYLINKLINQNNEIELITTDFCHNKKQKREQITEKLPFKVTMINEPGYKKNVCIKRFYSHYIWGKNVKKYLKTIEKPDVIYCSVPSLTGPLCASKFCKKNKIRFIIDVQDLWPEAFKMVFNPPIINKIIYYPFNKLANGIYKRADTILAVSNTYAQRALSVNKKCKNAYSVFLGTNLQKFDENAAKKIVTDNIKEKKCVKYKSNVTIIENTNFKLYKPKDEIWIGYCGTLGSSYDLDNAITAISKLDKYNIRFIVMGNGPLYDKFVKKSKEKQIKAVFTGRIPYDMMCSILCDCDISINPIMKGAAQSIINKVGDYAAAGVPVINTQECKEYRDLVEEAEIGLNCGNDPEDIANKIEILLNDKKMTTKMGKNNRKLAEQKFDREKTYSKIVELILK